MEIKHIQTKKFLDSNFLLENEVAEELYHEHAKDMPIIDYHCHLPPTDLADDRQFSNLTEIWLEGDHYKWRAMRTNGVDEKYITGDATAKEKFPEVGGDCALHPVQPFVPLDPSGVEKVF